MKCKCGKTIEEGRADKYCKACRSAYQKIYREKYKKKADSKLISRIEKDDCKLCAFNGQKGCTQRVCILLE